MFKTREKIFFGCFVFCHFVAAAKRIMMDPLHAKLKNDFPNIEIQMDILGKDINMSSRGRNEPLSQAVVEPVMMQLLETDAKTKKGGSSTLYVFKAKNKAVGFVIGQMKAPKNKDRPPNLVSYRYCMFYKGMFAAFIDETYYNKEDVARKFFSGV